jgi:hypothetical protein
MVMMAAQPLRGLINPSGRMPSDLLLIGVGQVTMAA